MTPTRRSEELFLQFRQCLRDYASENAITLSLLAVICIVTWAWILIVAVIF